MKTIVVLTFGLFSFSTFAINCNLVQALGTSFKEVMLNEINQEVAGQSYELNSRKTLVINKVEDISFDGCKGKLKANVTLKRDIRRNAKGIIKLSADVTSFDGHKLCMDNTKVTSVELSNTLNLGEAMYKWVANKVLPDRTCFNL